jgi:hypothetical protein
MTETELKAMHAPAIQGGSWRCVTGKSSPAATGIMTTLYTIAKK